MKNKERVHIAEYAIKKFHEKKIFTLNLWEVSFLESVLNRCTLDKRHSYNSCTGQREDVIYHSTTLTNRQRQHLNIILVKLLMPSR